MSRLNWSTLKYMHASPLDYRWNLDHPAPDKAAYIIGRAIHCVVLEPERFNERFAVFPGKSRRGKTFEEWLKAHPGKTVLLEKEMGTVKQSAAGVIAHPVASSLLAGCRIEHETEWTDPVTGLECRGRIDAVSTAVVDIKSSCDPKPRKFDRDCAEYLYHGQVAFYHYGATAAGLIDGTELPYIIAAGNQPPYDVAAYAVKPEDLAAGRILCLRLMEQLQACIAADWWPGCAPDLQYLELPGWAAGHEAAGQEEW
jgi:hypothetical protein